MKKFAILLLSLFTLSASAQTDNVHRHKTTTSTAKPAAVPGVSDCYGNFSANGQSSYISFDLEYKSGKVVMKNLFIYREYNNGDEQFGTGTYSNGNLKLEQIDGDFHFHCNLKHKSKGVFVGTVTWWGAWGEDDNIPRTETVTFKRG